MVIMIGCLTNSFGQNAKEDKKRPKLPEISNVYFDQGSYDLVENHLCDLRVLANWLQQNEDVKILIVGYTDDRGTYQENYRMSMARAKSIRDYLIQKGVEQGRIEYGGNGERHRVFNDTTDYARAMNRRAELKLLYIQPKP